MNLFGGWFRRRAEGKAPPVERPRAIVAEVFFDRDAPADKLRALGAALAACQEAHDWIAGIGSLEELLRGECPMGFSKAVGTSDGSMTPIYDPVLVWGWLDHPARW